jgi:hypothetical protein
VIGRAALNQANLSDATVRELARPAVEDLSAIQAFKRLCQVARSVG